MGVALLVRLAALDRGFPDFFDEAPPLRTAMKMWRGESAIEWRPVTYIYPSLGIYLHFAAQWITCQAGLVSGEWSRVADFLLRFETEPAAIARAGRLVETLADLATVAGAVLLGERLRRGAGFVAGAFVAVSPALLAASNGQYVESFATAFATLSLACLVGAMGASPAAAGLFAGLAASSKYPFAVLLLPITVMAARRPPAARSIALAFSCFALAFALTSPFVLLDPSGVRRDLGFLETLATGGNLGAMGGPALLFYLRALAAQLGMPLAIAALLTLLASAAPALRLQGVRTVALFVAAMMLGLGLASASFERYTVPLLPALAAVGAAGALSLAARAGAWRPLAAFLAALTLIALPARDAVIAARQPRLDTRTVAGRWCAEHLSPDELIMREQYGPALFTRYRAMQATSGRLYQAASPAEQQHYRARATHLVVDVPIYFAGAVRCTIPHAGRDPEVIDLVPGAAGFNRVYYDPLLVAAADVVITSTGMRGRYEAEPGRYPEILAAYRLLDRGATRIAEVHPDRRAAGPAIVVYRIPESLRDSALARPLDPLWWTGVIGPDERAALMRAIGAGDQPWNPADPRLRGPFAVVFRDHVAPYVRALAVEAASRGHVAVGHSLQAILSWWRTP
jgi:hypothetical protein